MQVMWTKLFPTPDACVTQTVPAYFEVEHASVEPLLLLYCAATTNDTFDDFCLNFTKADTSHHQLSAFNDTKIQSSYDEATYSPCNLGGPETGYIWEAIYPQQFKNDTLVLEFWSSAGSELAFCAQTWNSQAMNVTYTICWQAGAEPPECSDPVEHSDISSVYGLVPKDYPLNESLKWTMTWTGLPEDVRIFAAVFGESKVVTKLCGGVEIKI